MKTQNLHIDTLLLINICSSWKNMCNLRHLIEMGRVYMTGTDPFSTAIHMGP